VALVDVACGRLVCCWPCGLFVLQTVLH
jgi:hypothetical protein